MKITHITYGLGIGGIETMLVNLANEQLKLGHEISIIIINDIIDEKLLDSIAEGICVYQVGRKVGSKNILDILKLNKFIRYSNPDVIHIHISSISQYIFGRKYKKILCTTVHSASNEENSKNLHKAGRIFAISEYVKETIKNKTGLDSEVIYNGILTEKIIPDFNNREGNVFEIVQIGRLLHDVKGQDILLKAAFELRKNGVNDFHITFIGTGESEKYLKELTENLNLTDFVTFAGQIDQDKVLKNLHKYDLLVQPSYFDGFGLTVAEAISAGVPVLVADRTGLMEVVDNGKYGFVFKNGDYIDCSAMILKIINEGVSEDFRREAYGFVKTNFSISSTAKKYLDSYPIN